MRANELGLSLISLFFDSFKPRLHIFPGLQLSALTQLLYFQLFIVSFHPRLDIANQSRITRQTEGRGVGAGLLGNVVLTDNCPAWQHLGLARLKSFKSLPEPLFGCISL